MKKSRKTTEQLLEELDSRYGNPNGPVESKIILEGINRFREVYDELVELKSQKS